MMRAVLIVAAVLSLGALAACETATPYQPVAKDSAQWGGYSETKIAGDRWRVSFQGNSLTSRQTVENYLLYHAAELTVAQGFDWFSTAERATDKHVETWADPGPWGYGYGWRPYWRFYGGPWGGPWGPDVETTERFQTSAEIIMGHGPKPAGDHRALDAREVLTNLGPHIVRPK